MSGWNIMMRETTRKRKSPRRIRGKTKFWLLLIGSFILVESIFLMLLGGGLSSLHISPASARRKILRFLDPRWNRRQHPFDGSAMAVPPFHHSHLASRRDYRRLKPFQQGNNYTNGTAPLDDFYTRPHIPASSQQVPFLVVGGSDGSGTRGFVQTLMDLGVTMIVDNYDTMDVHGEEMDFVLRGFPKIRKVHGWPPLAQNILHDTRSVNYTFQTLSNITQKEAMEALLQLKSSLVQKGRLAAQQNRNPGRHPPAALGVQYGWKAPISLVLLPALQHVLGPIKFIHVIRDGRDVAMGDNQSPLTKFYPPFYGHLPRNGTKRESIQLWNDWNAQVYRWGRQRELLLDEDGQQTFGYLAMRSEDLIHPNTRLEALVQLAEFVGARVTPDELCCLSQRIPQDMGQSKRGIPERRHPDALLSMLGGEVSGSVQVVKARYGKWRHQLQGQPELVASLQRVGAEALKLFGYEPPARFLDRSVDVQAFPCDATVEQTLKCALE